VGNGTTTTSRDWYVGGTTTEEIRNDLLWGVGTTKTIFDPCPDGWMVPPTGTWNDFTATGTGGSQTNTPEAFGEGSQAPFYINGVQQQWNGNAETPGGTPTMVNSARNGRYYTSELGNVLVWYPTGGRREVGSAGLGGGGADGHYWSSSVSVANITQGAYFRFNNTTIQPSNPYARAYGESVRCLQE
jgi:hypothetical protein